jgi:RNA polymerase sigma-70 factor, ECF subfamily
MSTPSPTTALAPPSALSDEEIVARVRAGETGLYEILMRRNNARLYHLVRGIVRDESAVEDVMQQAYVAAYLHLGDFAGQSRFATWLGRIGINEALARVRRERRRGAGAMVDAEDAIELPSGERGPEERLAARELVAAVERAIDALPEPYRVVFVMREVEDYSTIETAECLGVTEEVVKVRLHRAKHKLRAGLLGAVDQATSAAFPFLRPRCDRVVDGVMRALALLGKPL